MSSLLCAKVLGLVVAVAALGDVSCGGKASRERGGVAAGGSDGAASSAGAAGAAGADAAEPSTVSVSVSGTNGEVDPHAIPGCVPGFQGFSAQAAGLSVELQAFVLAPGDYAGDPVQILWLDARLADGEHYQAAAGTAESSGAIALHVEQVDPRFIGRLEALLPAVDDPTRAPLMLGLSFDIAPLAGCP